MYKNEKPLHEQVIHDQKSKKTSAFGVIGFITDAIFWSSDLHQVGTDRLDGIMKLFLVCGIT